MSNGIMGFTPAHRVRVLSVALLFTVCFAAAAQTAALTELSGVLTYINVT
jgi:hypothetical protein